MTKEIALVSESFQLILSTFSLNETSFSMIYLCKKHYISQLRVHGLHGLRMTTAIARVTKLDQAGICCEIPLARMLAMMYPQRKRFAIAKVNTILTMNINVML